MRPPTRAQARAGLWALRARTLAQLRLRRTPLESLTLPPAPRLGLDATRGVNVALRVTGATCLQRSVVLQQWYAAHDVARDVVIGVTSPREGFRAHAWLEEPGERSAETFTEITRLPAAGTTASRATASGAIT